MLSKNIKRLAVLSAVTCLMAGAAAAKTVKVRISNNNSVESGLSLTPLYLGFHNGDFTGFNPGTTASAGIELLAEEGDFSTLAGERLAADPNAQGGVLTAPGGFAGAPVIEPGESASLIVDLAEGQNFLSYFSMIIPSNDLFIGTAGQGIDLRTIDLGTGFSSVITAANIWDAGTEINNNNGAAFNADQGNPALELDENGVITQASSSSLNALTGQTGLNGLTIGPSPVTFSATITISAVPLPAGAPLILSGLAAFGFLRHRKKKA